MLPFKNDILEKRFASTVLNVRRLVAVMARYNKADLYMYVLGLDLEANQCELRFLQTKIRTDT